MAENKTKLRHYGTGIYLCVYSGPIFSNIKTADLCRKLPICVMAIENSEKCGIMCENADGGEITLNMASCNCERARVLSIM